MYLGNLNIRSEWAKFVENEDKLNKVLCGLLRCKYEDEIDYKTKSFHSESRREKEARNEVWTDADEYDMKKRTDVFKTDALKEFDEQVKPGTEDFHKYLYLAVKGMAIDPKLKEELIKMFEARFLKAKDYESKWTRDGRKKAIGKRAAEDTDKYIKALARYTGPDGSMTQEQLDEFSEDYVGTKAAQEHIKSAYYTFLSKIKKRHPVTGDIVISAKKQAKQSAHGLVAELEDALIDNSDLREDIASLAAKEFTRLAHGKLEMQKSSEQGSGDRMQYDFHTKVTNLFRDDKGYVSSEFNMFWDSKSVEFGLGSTIENYVITSQEVIDLLEESGDMRNDLLRYNMVPSSENELLLEYLLDLYGKLKYYYLIDSKKEQVYPLSYLVKEDRLQMDPSGLYINQSVLLNDNKYQLLYAKAQRK